MNLKVVNLTENYAEEICKWKYEGEYCVYNYPAWSDILKDNWAITIQEKREQEFLALVDDYNFLCGYIRLISKKDYVIVALGLKPSLCGQGLGKTIMYIIKKICMKIYSNQKILLEVRSFNKRAIKCYEKAGFKIIEVFEKNICGERVNLVKMQFDY
ncbi:GNAT family N-acetyltransferase [Clostridium tarantellae]|uniref:GNAT family N-acetyltransferase n=1 Tax=Clostridium tarantellae TaxID=39493 RepID=A0A6I1MLX6_9CLOT|nr:GNAT family N-acetyltransferase [Clostridium tarantellae]MPQ43117.1 GNAT family N-acetyltransferase [Clostridium tarantellae]